MRCASCLLPVTGGHRFIRTPLLDHVIHGAMPVHRLPVCSLLRCCSPLRSVLPFCYYDSRYCCSPLLNDITITLLLGAFVPFCRCRSFSLTPPGLLDSFPYWIRVVPYLPGGLVNAGSFLPFPRCHYDLRLCRCIPVEPPDVPHTAVVRSVTFPTLPARFVAVPGLLIATTFTVTARWLPHGCITLRVAFTGYRVGHYLDRASRFISWFAALERRCSLRRRHPTPCVWW